MCVTSPVGMPVLWRSSSLRIQRVARNSGVILGAGCCTNRPNPCGVFDATNVLKRAGVERISWLDFFGFKQPDC